MGATAPREIIIANHQFGNSVTTPSPGTWWLALSTTIPNDDGTGFTEPSGGGYTRKQIANSTASFAAATTTNGVTTKANLIPFTFADPTGTWGLIVAYGWFDVQTSGTVQYWNPLDAPITVKNGNTPVEFEAGQLIMSFE